MIVYDRSPYGNSGKLINSTADSLIESSLPGNYSNISMNCFNKEYIIINNSEQLSFDIDNSFSISAWFKTKSNSSSSILVSKINKCNVGYEIVLDGPSGHIVFELINSLSNNHMRIDTVDSFNDDNWHHIVAVWDSTKNNANIFIDGNVRDHVLICDTLSKSIINTSDLQISGKNKETSLWQGMISNVAIYNNKITSEEVLLMYNQGTPISLNFLANKKFLVGYWNFKEEKIKKQIKKTKYYMMGGYDPELKKYHIWKVAAKPSLSPDPRYSGKLINIHISAILQ